MTDPPMYFAQGERTTSPPYLFDQKWPPNESFLIDRGSPAYGRIQRRDVQMYNMTLRTTFLVMKIIVEKALVKPY